MAMATLSLVPTPSALETSTGSFHFFRSSANSAPKLPMPPSTPGVKVRLAWWRILCFASSATAMFTPASAYFMKDLFASVSGLFSDRGARCRAPVTDWNSLERRGGSRRLLPATTVRQDSLKSPENPVPAHDSGMQEGIRVGKKPLANLPRLPGIRCGFERHVDHHRRADHIFSRHTAPESAVHGITTIIAHDEIAILRNPVRKLHVLLAVWSQSRRCRFGGTSGVILDEFLSVDPDGAIVNVDCFTRQADDALHIIGLIGSEGRLENHDLLALGRTPERHVPIGEGHARVVADAAHDEVIADEQRVFHRA